uniref:Rho-GAP domain-containing protein n=1 Tax=Electrophorus electricus TaxID=8005 RepID=A0A4W4FS59_ELEEL
FCLGARALCSAVQIREDMKKMVHPPMAQPWHGPAPARPSGSPGVFGVALLDVRELGLVKDGVPMVMRTMVEYLRQHGLEQEGLFRVSGSVRAVDGLRRRLDSREQWVELGQEVEVCTVASLLKQYLRELPEGLVHPSVQNALIQLQQDGNNLLDVRSLLQRLPDVHYSVLRYLCHFLTQVEQQQNMLWHCFDGMHEQSVCNKITATLIQNYSAIFGPDEGAERAETEALNVILVKVGAATSVSSLMQPIRCFYFLQKYLFIRYVYKLNPNLFSEFLYHA